MTTLFAQTESGFMAEQAAGSTLDYGLDWSDWLAKAPGDAITSSDWTVVETGLTLTNKAFSGAITSVWTNSLNADTWYTLVATVGSRDGRSDSRVCLLHMRPPVSAGSALFPNRLVALAKMRRDRLMLAATSVMPNVGLTDDYLWDKLRAAESETSHELRVRFGPTTFFPDQPTQAEITALNGMPWAIDPGYDYQPNDFQFNDKWGMIKLRNKPLVSVSRVRFAYPGGVTAHYDLPLDWIRSDKKYGQIQFVPSSTAFAAPLNAFVMQAIGMGRTIPLAIQITYVAGLANAAADYPELVDVVMKKAAIKILEDAFLPQSGSVSADGLSQSVSVDMDKYHDAIDRILHGGKGSNGGLMTAIHGVRVGAF